MPGEGADDDHEHHPDKGGDRNLLDQRRGEQDEAQKEQRSGGAGKTGAAADEPAALLALTDPAAFDRTFPLLDRGSLTDMDSDGDTDLTDVIAVIESDVKKPQSSLLALTKRLVANQSNSQTN